ncbi:hypothetical protein AOC06_02045 [Polynucleobacter paludilacus]|uniref:hypothetical protein n=1 Tax=Polynucleobacter paludilacus TaxID=1855895 RepID=UPI001BFE8F5F|nr:hypothetical protein [Polynucleobacter paludilacus]QWD34088.1 hypothetical protein G6676_02135 [Polynucleobacter paneuropaeus]QWD87384.1 hypothetical protein AOC06_02045 [Polynucleobacter paludilacus]
MKLNSAYLLATSFLVLATNAFAQTPKYEVSVSHLRNERYCEVLYGNRDWLSLKIKVFSTEGLNECPENLWKGVTEKTITDRHSASFVKLNGPRYWTIDGIMASGADTINHKRENFGGVEMNLRAVIDINLWQLFRSGHYKATPVSRETKWIYQAGKEVYELVSPEGQTYVMQSYSQIVNPTLTMKDLPTLGAQLKLPKGWTYQTRFLKEDLNLEANGTAYVLQDNLENSYQRK